MKINHPSRDNEQLLVSLSALWTRTQETEKNILDAAMARRDEVCARLEAIRPDAVLHAGEECQALTLEQGLFDQVIALAQARLAK